MAHKLKNGAEAHTLTKEEMGRGGTQKGVNCVARKMFKDILIDDLSGKVTVNGKEVTKKEAMMMKATAMALNGKIPPKDFVRVVEFIRDTIGEKPTEKVIIAEVEQNVVDEVERMVLGDDEETGS